MMNQDNPYAMNQTCKVCGEPAAGFHFGAFTCEGCKSFFGRSYNNLSSISDCKNNGECIINKKNRTACKACRLRKCLLVGMSKSGSRYGRRSNWFKIHCLLQEQQQQAAAAMAAHHNSQQQQQLHQQQQHQQHAQQHGMKNAMAPTHLPNSAAAAAALGMLGHAGAYPGLYPPRTKEELMMLGLEEYAKHPAAASPCVSSPDSHNSDSSVEVNVRNNPLLHLGKHSADAATPPQLRKDAMHPFLPLPFPGLSSLPVMPPPSFLPPSHLLFPGYHPALYQHHPALLKPSPEQQQAAAAAAAVQQLFNSTNSTPARFTPTLTAAAQSSPPHRNDVEAANNNSTASARPEHAAALSSPRSDSDMRLSNNSNNLQQQQEQHIANGNKAAAELTKRFYLDAVLKSQRARSPPPSTTKLPARSMHDHSISALVTPNSESGRERLASLQSQEDEHEALEMGDTAEQHATAPLGSDCAEEEDLVVSMTPPCSPVASNAVNAAVEAKPAGTLRQQENPIDLSMKLSSTNSARSSMSSKSSSVSSTGRRTSSDSELAAETESIGDNDAQNGRENSTSVCATVDDEHNSRSIELSKTTLLNNNNSNNNNNSSSFSNNINNNNLDLLHEPVVLKRKIEELTKFNLELAERQRLEVKRLKMESDSGVGAAVITPILTTVAAVTTTTPLDLTTKV